MNTFIEVLGVTDALVFILYILIIISIGFFASRKVKNAKDFSTAGQSLTPLVLISSFLATFFGAFSGSGAMEMVGMFGLTAITILFSSNVGWFIMSLMAKNMRNSCSEQKTDKSCNTNAAQHRRKICFHGDGKKSNHLSLRK